MHRPKFKESGEREKKVQQKEKKFKLLFLPSLLIFNKGKKPARKVEEEDGEPDKSKINGSKVDLVY